MHFSTVGQSVNTLMQNNSKYFLHSLFVYATVCSMSKKHDALKQVRLEPDNAKKMRELCEAHPLKPSIVSLVNAILRQWNANNAFTPENRERLK